MQSLKRKAIYLTHARMDLRSATSDRALSIISNILETQLVDEIYVLHFGASSYQIVDSFSGKVRMIGVGEPFTKLGSFFLFISLIPKIFNLLNKDKFIKFFIFNSSYFRLSILALLVRFFYKDDIRFISQVCEWYGFFQFRLGFLNPHFWFRYISSRHLAVYFKNVICISSMMQQHYSKHGINVIRIPAIIDANLVKSDLEEEFIEECTSVSYSFLCSSDKVNLIFCGTLGKKKEGILEFLSVFKRDVEIKKVCNLVLLGIPEVEVERILGLDLKSLNRNSIYPLGILPVSDSRKIISKCDYSLILRNRNVNSMAGFPTKFAEAIALGTGVIATNTSDLSEYSRDLDRLIILEHFDSEKNVSELNCIFGESGISHSKLDYLDGRAEIHQYFMDRFERHCYIEVFTEFMNKAIC